MAVATEAPASFRSSAIRPGPISLVTQGIGEVLSRRRLIRYLVQATLKKHGSDTLLGNIWWIIDPLLQMLVYVVLVSVIFQRPQPDYALFVFSAILPWKWFLASVQDGIASVVGQERIIKQIAFPKLVLPLSSVFAGVSNFAFGLIPLAALMILFYRSHITHYLLFIPVVASVQLLMTIPIAIVLAGFNVFYRDIGNLAGHLLRLLFYVSPGIYSIDLIHEAAVKHPELAPLIYLNPWNVLFTAYHNVIYDSRTPDWTGLAIVAGISVLLTFVAIYVFKRLEPSFAKIL
jgi:lipopolysaccharide transport system permease protein/teichoic acid transport system permease protein